ncbi:MAG TPA: pilus assembly protein CpaE, partial [Actinotalea sp.]
GQLFTLSEMTIEAREFPTGTILGFNGTTEWALDSVAKDDVLWMPREDQLRELLGADFVSLVNAQAEDVGGAYRVTVRADGTFTEHEALTASDAYALALLAQLLGARRSA